MGFFDFFRKKNKKAELEGMMAQLEKQMFPGGHDEMKAQSEELKSLLGNRYDVPTIGGTLCYMTSHMIISREKSADRVVKRGALIRPENIFSESDAMIIYKYVVRKQFSKLGINDERAFQEFYKSLGNIEGGATTDVIPRGYGEYGLCATNPIPVRGVPANEFYLKKLALISGEQFTWKRIGSTCAENIKDPIDMYQLTTDSGKDLCTIYISPYQSVISNKAPKGFYIRK